MKRYDLRHLHEAFTERMGELIANDLNVGEVGIFLFEVGDFTPVHRAHDLIKSMGHELMNSLKFNEPDWTVVVKRLDDEQAAENAARYAEERAAKEAEEANEEEAS